MGQIGITLALTHEEVVLNGTLNGLITPLPPFIGSTVGGLESRPGGDARTVIRSFDSYPPPLFLLHELRVEMPGVTS